MKGQAISPPHNYPALKQESGIDCPGSVRGDWAGRSPALPGRASPPELHTRRIYEMCAKGPAFSCSRGICRGSLVPPGVGRRGLCGRVLGRSPVGPADGSCSRRCRGRAGHPTPSDQTPPRATNVRHCPCGVEPGRRFSSFLVKSRGFRWPSPGTGLQLLHR